MGSNNSSLNKLQVMVVGLQMSGKTFFLKKLSEMSNKVSTDSDIDQTIGYNLITFKYNTFSFDIWELGGDPVSRTYWPTIYRNLKIDIIIFMINLYDTRSHQEALKELLVLINEEELKSSKFVLLFNLVTKDYTTPNVDEEQKEEKELVESLLNFLRECPIHDYDNRVTSTMFDIAKMKDGENKTLDLLKEIFSIKGKNANI
jgi:ADP-ribosylation factor-like protein 2